MSCENFFGDNLGCKKIKMIFCLEKIFLNVFSLYVFGFSVCIIQIDQRLTSDFFST